ncbi:unnamed protein product [Brassica napus]|uniref:(rape) hypothetical protein n=1 Tax=Brassica napus TaxID=3708 RepID=A0A817A3P3_BRANA|nr:unnamed protein product [Brassica napus]
MRFVPSEGKKDSKRRRSWWQRFFFDDNDDGNWLGLREEDIVDEMSDEEKLETWKKRRAEVIVELREVQEEIGDNVDGDGSEDNSELDDLTGPERGFVKMVRDMVLGVEEEDTLYTKKTRPCFCLCIFKIAKTLAVRRSQKLVMVKELHRKKARYRLEVGIGKSPHLSDDDLWLRAWSWQRRRSENRKAFANIWSDMVFGISLFVILYAKQSKVALLKVYRISDTGKAFLIILATDIFLG